MGSGALEGQRQHIHNRKCSLALLAREPEAVHISKAGFLWKRAKVKRTWLKRWCVVRKGVFRYCCEPGQASACQERVLSGRVTSARKLVATVQRSSGSELWGFTVEDDTGRRKTFFCESDVERNSWCWYFKYHATQQVLVGDLYTVDWKNMLGSGYFAAVVRAWDKTNGTQVALKIMARSVFRDHLALLGREVAVMNAMGAHPHLLPLQQVMYAEQRLYLVTEYMDGGELAARCSPVRPLSEFEASCITRQLLLALAHLHARRICHTDIKPENILFATRAVDSPIKLIDFSLAVFFRQPAEPCGTPEFMAPELIANPDGVAKTGWGGEVDMWAVGILLYWMLSGRTPFEAASISSIFVNIELGRWSFTGECWDGVSEAAKGLIRSLLRRNPHHRPTAKTLLNHPWITRISSHRKQPSLNLHSRGVHPLKEVEVEGSCLPRPVSIRKPIACPPPQLTEQPRGTDAVCPHPFEDGIADFAADSSSWQAAAKSHCSASPIDPDQGASGEEGMDRCSSRRTVPEDECLVLDIPGSPAWSTVTESPFTPRRQWEYESHDDLDGDAPVQQLGIEDSAQCLDRHRSSKIDPDGPDWVISSPGDIEDDSDTPSSRRHAVIDFADLHKVRGITDLRRAIIAAERNNSLPSLVDQARRTLELSRTSVDRSNDSSTASAASLRIMVAA